MTAYVANYPGEREPDIEQALADQVETRILPRLRGLEFEPHSDRIRDLADLVRKQIPNEALASDIDAALERSERSGLFVWRGREN